MKIIDKNERNLIDMVKEYFKDYSDINICLEAHDGLEGINVISENVDNFDLIIRSISDAISKKQKLTN